MMREAQIKSSKIPLERKVPDRNTLKVYWYLLSRSQQKAGVRQVQRVMGFSSPNAAIFHLKRLVEMKLILQHRNGEYQICKKERIGEMKAFLILGHHFIPIYAIYAIIMTTIMIFCTLILLPVFSYITVFALLPGLMSMCIFWYETYLVWRKQPKFISEF
ncbi:MAG: hypothetical protein ACFFCF_00060 [Promethearchaeota archaeon]